MYNTLIFHNFQIWTNVKIHLVTRMLCAQILQAVFNALVISATREMVLPYVQVCLEAFQMCLCHIFHQMYICTDINECAIESYTCTNNTECKNAPGSYQCDCVEGYVDKNGECEGSVYYIFTLISSNFCVESMPLKFEYSS